MEDFANKYLSKKEALRFSNPRYICNNIRYLFEVAKLVDKYPDEIKTQLHEIKKFKRPNLKISIKLMQYFAIELYAYYKSVEVLFSSSKYKESLSFPAYYYDGTLENLRHCFGHPDAPYKTNKKRMDSFENKYSVSKLIQDFDKFEPEAQQLIINYNNELVASRLTAEDKKFVFEKHPKSYIALLINEQNGKK